MPFTTTVVGVVIVTVIVIVWSGMSLAMQALDTLLYFCVSANSHSSSELAGSESGCVVSCCVDKTRGIEPYYTRTRGRSKR